MYIPAYSEGASIKNIVCQLFAVAVIIIIRRVSTRTRTAQLFFAVTVQSCYSDEELAGRVLVSTKSQVAVCVNDIWRYCHVLFKMPDVLSYRILILIYYIENKYEFDLKMVNFT